MATTLLPWASSSRLEFSAMLPRLVSGSGSVISSGAWDAISAMALSADATVTRPAPARSAAIPAIAAAPVLPREPATTSA